MTKTSEKGRKAMKNAESRREIIFKNFQKHVNMHTAVRVSCLENVIKLYFKRAITAVKHLHTPFIRLGSLTR